MLGYCFQLESRQKSLWKYFNRDTIKTAAWYLSAVNIELSIINYVVIHTNHNSWESPLFLGVHFYFSSLLVFFSVGCVRSVGRSVGRRGQVVIVICIVPMPYNAQWTTMRLHNTQHWYLRIKSFLVVWKYNEFTFWYYIYHSDNQQMKRIIDEFSMKIW